MAAHVTLTCAKSNAVPDGARWQLRWNGTLADNGDGMQPAEPLSPPYPVLAGPFPLWSFGKAGVGNEPCGEGYCGIHENYGPSRGCGLGPCGVGDCGLNTDVVTFSTAEVLPALRDGDYTFWIEYLGPLSEPSDSMAQVNVTVIGTPRPPSRLTYTGWDAEQGTIGLAWDASPDVE